MADFPDTLHVDESPAMTLRTRIFGHPDGIIPFREGFIAKKCKIFRELRFYFEYLNRLRDIIPENLVPQVEGIVDNDNSVIDETEPEIHIKLTRQLSLPDIKGEPYLMMRDITRGYVKPAVLDIKMGLRTWALGAEPEKVERMRGKCGKAPTSDLQFRIRAGMWLSRNPEKWQKDGEMSYVTRKFGNTCSHEELVDFLRDFFHFQNLIPFYLNRLKQLKESLIRLRKEKNARLYSSSVLITYDESDPNRRECRLLDFAKTYFDIAGAAAKHNEDLEECEDGVIPAVGNLILVLEQLENDN